MSRVKMFIAIALAFAVPACKGGGGGGGTGGGGGNTQERFARALEEAKPMFDALRAVRDAIPDPGTLEESECPKDQFQQVGDRPEFLLRLTWNDLVKITGGEESLRTTADSEIGAFGTVVRSRVARLNGPTPESWQYPNDSTVREAMQEFGNRRFAAILYPTKVEPPVRRAQSFEGGVAEGWIILVRLADGERLCQARVSAESGGSVTYTVRTTRSDDRENSQEHALREDLKKKLETAIVEKLKAMTGGMQ